MLGIKLVDVDTSNARTEQTGTCELCFGSMWCDNPVLIFEKPDGEQIRANGFRWDWGDYHEFRIDNYLNFSDWFSKKDINCKQLETDYRYLENLLEWYYEETSDND
nr:MAG TPA: hypothetical protein [Caudoviricetes sp.]